MATYNSIYATFFSGSTRTNPDFQTPNKRPCILLTDNGLRCGFLATSILGGWGRLGPGQSPWDPAKKSGPGAAAGGRQGSAVQPVNGQTL